MEAVNNKDFTLDMYEKYKRIFLDCMKTVFEKSYPLDELKAIDEKELVYRKNAARSKRGAEYTPTLCVNSKYTDYEMFDVQTYTKIFTTLKAVRIKVVGDWLEDGKKLDAEANKVLNLSYLVKEYRNEIAHDNPIADIMSSAEYMLLLAESFKSALNADGKSYYEEMQRIKNNLPHTVSCDEVKSDYEDLVGTGMKYTDDYGICKAANDFGGGSYAGNIITVPQYHRFLGRLIGGENEVSYRKNKTKQRIQFIAVIALFAVLVTTIGAILFINTDTAKRYKAPKEAINNYRYNILDYVAWITEAEYVDDGELYGSLYFTVKSSGLADGKSMCDYEYSVYYSPGGKPDPNGDDFARLPWMGFINISDENSEAKVITNENGYSEMKCKYKLGAKDDLLYRYIKAYGLGRMQMHLTFTPILADTETENPIKQSNR